MSYNIGIIGKGFVGGAMYENFKDVFNTLVWDIDESKRTVTTFKEFVDKSDVIFICVPTPMKQNGECDVFVVSSVIDDIAQVDRNKYVIIKSTVTPGTTERLASDFNMKIAFNPEFLTEAKAVKDFQSQSLIVLGADDDQIGTVMARIYYEFNNKVGNQAHVIQRTTKEAELFKYLANSFLATKVIFANEFKILCDKVGVDYSRIAEVAALDKRLGHTHWRVPGPDGKLGFGGSCFPKDTAALLAYADEVETALWLLTEATYINQNIRGEKSYDFEIVENKQKTDLECILSLVLIVDKSGTPKNWCNYEIASCYYARDKVLWETGSKIKTLLGGHNDKGEQSKIVISSIIGVSGPILGDKFYNTQTVFADRMTLYSRDRHMCAYCGNVFNASSLTIDHVHPKSRGGTNRWTNCVTACRPCNHRKGWKTPEEAKLQLLYIPYAPTVHERILLKNRKVLADQMEFLLASIPKNSRVWSN